MNRGIKLSFAMSLVFCVLSGISMAVLSSPRSSAVDATATATANATVTVAKACTMTSGGTNDTPHSATIPAGTNKSDIGQTTFKVVCNDSEGFSVYAVGYANYELGNTKLLATVGGSLNPTYDIETGLSMDTSTSSWAMKLTPVSGTYAPTIQSDTNGAFSSYHIVPSTNTKVATYAGVTDGGTNATGSAFTATYRANIAGNQPAGNYNGKVKYTMVHPASAFPVEPLDDSDCPANNVCYAPNADDIVGTMVSTTNVAPTLTSISASARAAKQIQTYNGSEGGGVSDISSYGTIKLVAPNYSREGYGFAGWSTDFEVTYDSIIYGPEETIDKPASIANHGLILYPVWVSSAGFMQNASSICSGLTTASWDSVNSKMSATLDSVSALIDERDGNTYAIAKLADGNCWMIENLRLDADNSSDSSLAQGFGGVFAGLADSEDTNFGGSVTVGNSLYYFGSQGGTASINIGNGNSPASRIPRYNDNNTNRALSVSHNATSDTVYYQWYSYGNYYNWAAAMANTNYYSGPTAQVDGKTSETVNTSICPTGWRLPYGRNTGNGATSKSFSYLDTCMGGSGATVSTTASATARSRVWRSFPNNFVNPGYYNSAGARERGVRTAYWSSTADSTNQNTFTLGFYYFSRFSPGTTTSDRTVGHPIRCVIND